MQIWRMFVSTADYPEGNGVATTKITLLLNKTLLQNLYKLEKLMFFAWLETSTID